MIKDYKNPVEKTKLCPLDKKTYDLVPQGKSFGKYTKSGSRFNVVKQSFNKPITTYTSADDHVHPIKKRKLLFNELLICSSFPMDFKYETIRKARWAMGMSVPPFMVQRIALEIIKQWNLRN